MWLLDCLAITMGTWLKPGQSVCPFRTVYMEQEKIALLLGLLTEMMQVSCRWSLSTPWLLTTTTQRKPWWKGKKEKTEAEITLLTSEIHLGLMPPSLLHLAIVQAIQVLFCLSWHELVLFTCPWKCLGENTCLLCETLKSLTRRRDFAAQHLV